MVGIIRHVRPPTVQGEALYMQSGATAPGNFEAHSFYSGHVHEWKAAGAQHLTLGLPVLKAAHGQARLRSKAHSQDRLGCILRQTPGR